MAQRRIPRIIILGAGFGGLSAARLLAHATANVIVIDRRNHYLFQPLLYQVATATLPVTEITYPIRTLFRKQPNVQVLLATAEGIDLKSHCVVFRDSEISYDYLIIATGAEPSYFGHEHWRTWATPLKTIEDGVEVRRRILLAFEQAEREANPQKRKSLLTFVIVGGGSTGVELAGALADLSSRVMTRDFRSIRPQDARIMLVEAGDRILPELPERLPSNHSQNAVSKF